MDTAAAFILQIGCPAAASGTSTEAAVLSRICVCCGMTEIQSLVVDA